MGSGTETMIPVDGIEFRVQPSLISDRLTRFKIEGRTSAAGEVSIKVSIDSFLIYDDQILIRIIVGRLLMQLTQCIDSYPAMTVSL